MKSRIFTRVVSNFKLLLVISILTYLQACSSSGRYSSDDKGALLGIKRAIAESENISVQIPNGWFNSVDNELNHFDLWLIRDDYKAIIGFVTVSYEAENQNELIKTLNDLVGYDKIVKKNLNGESFNILDDVEFKVGETLFLGYNYRLAEDDYSRTLFFRNKERFYEVTLSGKGVNLNEVDVVFNLVLESIK